MKTREEALAYGLSFKDTHIEAPFHDENWQLVRVKDTDKVFLWLYERNGYMKFSLLCVGLYDYFEKSPRMFRNNQQQS